MASLQSLPPILGAYFLLTDYPESVQTEAIERELAASLPPIAGLDEEGMTTEQRKTVYQKLAGIEQCAFVRGHGDPFGCETVSFDSIFEVRKARVANV